MEVLVKSDNNVLKGKINTKFLDGLTMKKPKGILVLPRLFYQYVVFVMDGSASMRKDSINGIPKGKEINNNIRQTLEYLKKSKNSSSFDISIYAFSRDMVDLFGIKSLNKIDLNQSFDPISIVKTPSSTYLANTLKEVNSSINNYFTANINKNHQALVLILTDGLLHDSLESFDVVQDIKKNSKITVSTMYLGNSSDTDNNVANELKTFASDESLFLSTIDPEEIRKHMIKSISTVSKIG